MRVLSYNIHKGIGGRDRRYNLDRIVRVIEHENPDIFCLQEVTHNAKLTAHDDQPHLLQKAFAFPEAAFQKNVHYKVGGYGNLIVSRWPMPSRHHLSLQLGSRKPRGAQVVVIDSPEGKIRLANWHLGLTAGEQRWQANHLLHHPLFREFQDLPTLVIGDCNDWRNRLAPGLFTEQQFNQASTPPSRFRSFPAFLPTLSLDKAFYQGLVIREVKIIRTPLAHQASDHLPLVIDFHLPPL